MRVINGDGAQWIQKNNPKNCANFIYAGEISALLERLKTALNKTTDAQEKESLAELLGYYKSLFHVLTVPKTDGIIKGNAEKRT